MTEYENDYQLISAYLDGELTEAEHQLLEQRLTKEPALRTVLTQYIEQQQSYIAAIKKIDDVPMSANLYNLLHTNAKPTKPKDKLLLTISHWLTNQSKKLALPNVITATAASCVIIFSLTLTISTIRESHKSHPETEFNHDLSKILAGQEIKGSYGTLYETLAFKRTDSALCKYITLKTKQTHEKIVCRNNDIWVTEVTLTTPAASPDNSENLYVPAGNQLNLIDDYITSTIQGTELSAAEEEAMLNIK